MIMDEDGPATVWHFLGGLVAIACFLMVAFVVIQGSALLAALFPVWGSLAVLVGLVRLLGWLLESEGGE